MKRDPSEHDRCLELLADRATQRLSASEEDELETLLARHPQIDADAMDRAAATLASAGAAPIPMPEDLRDRVENDADRHLAGGRRLSPLHRIGWLVAAAALALAVTTWFTSTPKQREPIAAQPTAPTAPQPPIEKSPPIEPAPPVESYADALILPWRPKDNDPKAVPGIAGEVVWSTTAQRGYLRIRGLRPNDPDKSQYQLWIFDRDRAAEFPVSGGVFDIASNAEKTDGDIIVPIQPSHRVFRPSGFALTVEKPGGEVVSDRTQVLLTAEPDPGNGASNE